MLSYRYVFAGERAFCLRSVYRLKENRDFRRVFQRGRSLATGRLVLYWFEHRNPHTFRVGFSISKKVGNAVMRNLLKRRLRDIFLRITPELQNSKCDFVVVCRKPAAEATFDDLQGDVLKLLRRAKFMV